MHVEQCPYILAKIIAYIIQINLLLPPFLCYSNRHHLNAFQTTRTLWPQLLWPPPPNWIDSMIPFPCVKETDSVALTMKTPPHTHPTPQKKREKKMRVNCTVELHHLRECRASQICPHQAHSASPSTLQEICPCGSWGFSARIEICRNCQISLKPTWTKAASMYFSISTVYSLKMSV